jgi:hypothetical protein
MKSVKEVSKLIQEGRRLLLAGSHEALAQLPAGEWIAGTIPYFMSESGGIITHDLIQVTELPAQAKNIKIRSYNASQLSQIPSQYFSNGFNFILIPAFGKSHQTFAEKCTTWTGLFNQPLVGWVSGMDLKQSSRHPQVVNGQTGKFLDDEALVMHIELSSEYFAQANIINIFKPGDGDVISFSSEGFEFQKVFINGQETSFSQYLEKNAVNLQLPLVANYFGAMINVSFRDVDSKTGRVRFYAPVFPGVEYRLAKPISNYEKEFDEALKKAQVSNPLFACNCILNFLYANLEGKRSGGIASAMTFGEIAYMLLNQTMVYINVEKK